MRASALIYAAAAGAFAAALLWLANDDAADPDERRRRHREALHNANAGGRPAGAPTEVTNVPTPRRIEGQRQRRPLMTVDLTEFLVVDSSDVGGSRLVDNVADALELLNKSYDVRPDSHHSDAYAWH